MAIVLLFLGLAAASAPAAQPGNPPVAAAKQLMGSLAGRWSCTGAFASGRPLRARIEFTADLEGEGLRFRHWDLPPTAFVADALWSIDADGALVSLAWTGMQGSGGRSPALYVSDQLSATSVRLVQVPFLRPPFAPNRFTYSLSNGKLTMVWEVQRATKWTVGDYLACARDRRSAGIQG